MNNFIGEQFNQHGNYNIGKIDARSGNSPSLSVTEQAAAVAELADFIQHLEQSGLLTENGDPVDENLIESAVANQESKLRKVVHALAHGGKRALSSSLNHIVAPIVVALIEKRWLGMH